jgi:hypothetical protein
MSTPRAALLALPTLLLSASAIAAPDGPASPSSALAAVVDEIQAQATAVRVQLRAARAERDIIKTLCLNDKLNQLDVAARTAEAQREEALASTQPEALAQAQARMEVQRQTARRVTAEAQQCVGVPEPSSDRSGPVVMTEPPLPTMGDYPAPVDVFTAVAPPLSVSAYK